MNFYNFNFYFAVMEKKIPPNTVCNLPYKFLQENFTTFTHEVKLNHLEYYSHPIKTLKTLSVALEEAFQILKNNPNNVSMPTLSIRN